MTGVLPWSWEAPMMPAADAAGAPGAHCLVPDRGADHVSLPAMMRTCGLVAQLVRAHA